MHARARALPIARWSQGGRVPTSRSGRGGDGKPGRSGTEVYGDRDILPRDGLAALRCLWRRR